MVFGSLLPRPRGKREKAVRDLAAALNSLDYGRAGELLADDIVVFNVRGGRTEGRDAFIEKDRGFREPARAVIALDDIIHHNDEVLVRGRLDSPVPEVGGPTMWRVGFNGPLISEIEITRSGQEIDA
nr:nuclear transport factor 2 family protein [Qipengyuania polymorpha]